MELYPEPESAVLEFKEELPKNHHIANTVIAFCNQHGGQILLGVADDRQVVGVPENSVSQVIEALQDSIYKSCTPTVIPAIYTQRIGDKLIIVIHVSAGMNKPYYRTQEGLINGTYIRVGASTVKATAEMRQELQWQARGYSLDEWPVYHSSEQDIDTKAFAKFLKQHKQSAPAKQLVNLMQHYKILVAEHSKYYPSTAGMLLFGKKPQHFLTEAFIICSHFKGTLGRETLATRDCLGSLFQQVEESFAFIVSCLNRQYTIEHLKRTEKYEIPLDALREVLINAIVHRNYQIPAPNKIAIYEDRIEIFSPGNFPGPLTLNQLEMGFTYLRNRIIARVFREAGFAEKMGSGFSTLFQRYREWQLPAPQVLEGNGFVKCILPRPHQNTQALFQLEDREAKILRLLQVKPEITVHDVVMQCTVSRQTAVRILAKLIAQKRIKKINRGKATRYQRL